MSKLLEMSNAFRKDVIVKNSYNEGDRYSSSHKDAISDGDDKGKNEIGSQTDINTRLTNVVKNSYNENDRYSSSHKDAISVGDDKGKNDVGSKTDINTRITNVVKNGYSPNKTYPDF